MYKKHISSQLWYNFSPQFPGCELPADQDLVPEQTDQVEETESLGVSQQHEIMSGMSDRQSVDLTWTHKLYGG